MISAATLTPSPVGHLPNFIATNLRVLRRASGWSQTELAERVGLNRGNIASYESGNAEPSICKLLRISSLFDVSTRDFTRRDLRDPTELTLARSLHAGSDGLDAYHRRHEELDRLITASRQLFEYKRQSMTEPCEAAELIAGHYLQLLDLSKRLLDEHGGLLDKLSLDTNR